MEHDIDWALRQAGDRKQVVTEDIGRAILDEMPAYLWIDSWYEGERTVWCGRCGNRWTERKSRKEARCYRQGYPTECPVCRERVFAKYLSRGHAFEDRLDAVWYKKSEEDPNRIVAIAGHCRMDYDQDYPQQTEPDIHIRGIAVFEYGAGHVRFQRRPHWERDGYNRWWAAKWSWDEVKAPGNMTFGTEAFTGWNGRRPPRVMLRDTLEDALRGTPFARAWSEDYLMMERNQDGAKALMLISKRPCVEYLTKLGMTGFLRARLLGELPANAVNWRGRTASAVLRLSRQRLGEIKSEGIRLTPRLQQALRWADENGVRCTARIADRVEFLLRDESIAEVPAQLNTALEGIAKNRWPKALKYMARILENRVEAGTANTLSIRDFRDYWNESRILGANLNEDAVAFPADFYEAHDRAAKRMETLRDAGKDALIRSRWDDLNRRYGYSFGGLILRPARDSAEVIREGEVLGHCVGSYVRSYAEGRTIICVLRRAVEPDAPWRTVEIDTSGRVAQDRGWKNDRGGIALSGAYAEALNVFWSAWRERRRTA